MFDGLISNNKENYNFAAPWYTSDILYLYHFLESIQENQYKYI